MNHLRGWARKSWELDDLNRVFYFLLTIILIRTIAYFAMNKFFFGSDKNQFFEKFFSFIEFKE